MATTIVTANEHVAGHDHKCAAMLTNDHNARRRALADLVALGAKYGVRHLAPVVMAIFSAVVGLVRSWPNSLMKPHAWG